jgi:hypothetical protein
MSHFEISFSLAQRKIRVDLILIFILLLASFSRFNGLDWGASDFVPNPDSPHSEAFYTFHPDEVSNIKAAGNFATSDSWRPTGDLYGQKLDYSLYGATTLYLHVISVRLLDLFADFTPYDYDDPHSNRLTTLAIRWLTALLGLACLPLLYLGMRSLYGRPSALLSTALLAFAAFHAQSGRFGTVDIPMVFFTLWSFAHLTRLMKSASWFHLLMAALAAGLALSTKLNAALVIFPLIAVEWLRVWPKEKTVAKLLRTVFSARLWAAAGVVVGVFFLLNPYAFLDWENYLFADHAFGLVHILKNVRGEFFYPFQIQFQDIQPFSFLLGNVLKWAAGPALEIAGLVSLLYLAFKHRPRDLVLLAWIVPAFLMTANAQVMFMRYALPFLPLLAMASGVLLSDLLNAERPLLKRLGWLACASVLLPSFVWTQALASVHGVEDSRIQAGRYLLDRLPHGTSLLHERSANTIKPVLHRPFYTDVCMEIPSVYRADGNLESEKLEFLIDRLRQVEWAAILESNRALGYSRTSKYLAERLFYKELFAENLGFTVDTLFQTLPHWGPFEIEDREAEFSLRYYDHEAVFVFHKTDPAALETGLKRLAARFTDADDIELFSEGDHLYERALQAFKSGELHRARELASAVIENKNGKGRASALNLLAKVFLAAAEQSAETNLEEQKQLLQNAQRFFTLALQEPTAPLGRKLRGRDLIQFYESVGDQAAAAQMRQSLKKAGLL